MRERGGKNTDKENLGELWDIYYNNRSQKSPGVIDLILSLRDLRLLLDLLATSSGIAPAIAIMTLFDRVCIKKFIKNLVSLRKSKDCFSF